MTLQKLRLFQLLAEAVIPIYGIFFANWSFSSIVYFYILDLLFYIFLSCLKLQKTRTCSENISYLETKKTLSHWSLILSCFLATLILVLIFTLRHQIDNTSISESFKSFFFTKEMGIPQGFLLIPVLFLGGWQQYKMIFIRGKMYMTDNVFYEYQVFMRQLLLILLFLILTIFIIQLINVPRFVIVFIFVVSRIAVNLLQMKKEAPNTLT